MSAEPSAGPSGAAPGAGGSAGAPAGLPPVLAVEPLAAPPDATVRLPGSKSLTNRALVLAALSDGHSVVRRALRSRDTLLMAAALSGLGAEVDTTADDWAVTPGRFDRVLDLHECHLQSTWSARLVNGMRALALAEGWAPWHTRDHTGFLRHLVIRQAGHTDDRMVNLVTNGHDEARLAGRE